MALAAYALVAPFLAPLMELVAGAAVTAFAAEAVAAVSLGVPRFAFGQSGLGQ
jgi:hypothetical protein